MVQHAFAGGALAQGLVSDTERRALALSGSGDLVFDWDVAADKIFISPQNATAAVETQLEAELLKDGGVIPSILKKAIAQEAHA